MMSGILFIRHAATDMAGTFCGHSDPPVNAQGREQIENMLACLSDEAWDAVYSSDLKRAVTTAEPLARASHCHVVTTPGLREIHFGSWEGLTWKQIEERDAAYAQRWIESFPFLDAPMGESFAVFEQRVLKEVERLSRIAEGKRVAVVTHGGVMRVVLRKWLGCTEQQSWEQTKTYCSTFFCSTQVTSRTPSQ